MNVDGIAAKAWETLWEQLAGPMAFVDLQGRHLDVNPSMCRMLRYDRAELMELRPADVTHPGDPVLDKASIARLIAEGGTLSSVEKRLVRSDGTMVWVLINSSLVRDEVGNPLLIVSQFHDITARRQSEMLWHQTLANAPIGMALMDLDGRWIEVNERLASLVGYRREDMVGRPSHETIYDGYRHDAERVLDDLREGRRTAGAMEICLRHRDGHPFWMLTRYGVVPGADDRPAYLVSQFEPLGDDLAMSPERLTELTRMALRDPLTGLANRALLIERFQQEVAALGEQGGGLAVLTVDLDGFKPVNDRYGHHVGDDLLRVVADKLVTVVRCADTVARVGGDEFVVLALVRDRAHADDLRERVVRQVNADVVVSGRAIALRASVGIAHTDDPAVAPADLMRRADQDMYGRKERAR
ncbi:PAS domain S-box protein [Saccharopolyspora cebuensis]|uniref:PAS domain S-box protein n=1 Tax=Saccharopolyspora cebuensis TaxID=418759 RepID=A0ABV4CL42_9PSEU